VGRPKYPRIYRIPHPSGYRHGTKRYLTLEELREVFSGRIYVEEKLDGSQFSVMKEEGEVVLYSRGANIVRRFEPLGYKGIWRLVYEHYESFSKLPERYVLYGEWLRVRHTVPYDALPDWAVIFDVLDLEARRFLSYEEKARLLDELELVYPPLLDVMELECRTRRDVKEVIKRLARIASQPSRYSTVARSMEGVVVKNYAKGLFAKLINPWFDIEVEESELFRGGLKFNSLARQSYAARRAPRP